MDEHLLERYRLDGDREALAALFRRHQEPVYRFLVGYVGNRALAEEATQETFLRVIRSANEYHPIRPLRSWLYTIALNAARDMVRSETARKKREDRGKESIMRDDPNPLEKEESAELLRAEVSALPEEVRVPVTMRYFSEMTYDEIAETLQVPQGTIVSRIHKGLQRLRERLTQLGLAGLIPSLETHLITSGQIAVPEMFQTVIASLAATAVPTATVTGTAAAGLLTTRAKAWLVAAASVVILGVGTWIVLRPTPNLDLNRSTAKLHDENTESAKSNPTKPASQTNATETGSQRSSLPDATPKTTASIHGVIRGEDDQLIMGATVQLYRGEFRDYRPTIMDTTPFKSLESDMNGAYSISNLSEGYYELKASYAEHFPTGIVFFLKNSAKREFDIHLGRCIRVTGTVQDVNGDLIKGVKVEAELMLFEPQSKAPSREDWEEGHTEIHGETVSDGSTDLPSLGKAESVTDDRGRYRFLVSSGPWSFHTESDVWRTVEIKDTGETIYKGTVPIYRSHLQERVFVKNIATDHKDLSFIVQKGLTLEGKVIDQDGKPIAMATGRLMGGEVIEISVMAEPDRMEFSETHDFQTNTEGMFTLTGLPALKYSLKVGKEDYGVSEGYQMIELNENKNDLVVTIPRGLTLSGKFVDDRGQPISRDLLSGHSITIVAVSSLWHDPRVDRRRNLLDGHIETATTGQFRLFPLEKGRYRIEVTTPFELGKLYPLEVDIAADRDDLELRIQRGWTISGKAVKPTGEPAEDLNIDFIPSGSQQPLSKAYAYGSDAYGYRPGHFRSDPLPSGTYTVRASAPWLKHSAETQAVITDSHVKDVILTVDAGLSIKVLVKNPGGTNVSWGKYTNVGIILKQGGEILRRVPENPKSSGDYHIFHGLEPGTYTLEVELGEKSKYKRTSSATVTIAPGQTQIPEQILTVYPE